MDLQRALCHGSQSYDYNDEGRWTCKGLCVTALNHMINSSFGLGSFSRAAERATIKLWRLGKLKLQAPHVYGITV